MVSEVLMVWALMVWALAIPLAALMVWALAIPWVHRSEWEEASVQRLTNSHNSCPAR